jgi:UDP-N-acetylmuramyl pentapeptide synthase
VRLLGRAFVRAALAAVAVAVSCGVPAELALERLSTLGPTPRRLSPARLPSGAWLLRDEYKSSLETVDNALDVLADLPVDGRRIVVMGEISEPPGSQGPIYRRIGERVAEIAISRSSSEAISSATLRAPRAREWRESASSTRRGAGNAWSRRCETSCAMATSSS